jgi:hypothetical protein
VFFGVVPFVYVAEPERLSGEERSVTLPVVQSLVRRLDRQVALCSPHSI